MVKLLPALEGYMLANVATQNLFNANPLEFMLGDLNQGGLPMQPTGFQMLMGPTPAGTISLRELLTNTMSGQNRTIVGWTKGQAVYGTSNALNPITQGSNFETVAQNFSDNIGNIIISTAGIGVGFRVAKKVLRKPIGMANKTLRNLGLGSTLQF